MIANGLTMAELLAERAIALPDKEVVSVIDVNADIDLNINAASPIDLAAAANLNVAAPIQAAAGANVLSYGSDSTATATHADTGVVLTQYLGADANATSTQDSNIDQGPSTTDTGGTTGGTTGDTGGTTGGTTGDTGGTTGGTGGTTGDTGGTTGAGGTTTGSVGTGGLLSGSLLNVNVNVHLDTNLAAPIGGAAAVNGNVAAPISAAVGANIGTINSHATALSVQDAVVDQQLNGSANATQNQVSAISQGAGSVTGTSGTLGPAALGGATTNALGPAASGGSTAGADAGAGSTSTGTR